MPLEKSPPLHAFAARLAWLADPCASARVGVTSGCLGTLRAIDPLQLPGSRIETLRFKPLARRMALHPPCNRINAARTEATTLDPRRWLLSNIGAACI